MCTGQFSLCTGQNCVCTGHYRMFIDGHRMGASVSNHKISTKSQFKCDQTEILGLAIFWFSDENQYPLYAYRLFESICTTQFLARPAFRMLIWPEKGKHSLWCKLLCCYMDQLDGPESDNCVMTLVIGWWEMSMYVLDVALLGFILFFCSSIDDILLSFFFFLLFLWNLH